MFITKNEAGLAIAILLAGALILLGLQGTPLTKRGFKDYQVEIMAREEAREKVAEQALKRADENPAEAQGMLEGYQVADPGAQSSPAVSMASSAIYEQRVLATLRALANDPSLGMTVTGSSLRDDGPDAWLTAGATSIAVNVKYIRVGTRSETRGYWSRELDRIAEQVAGLHVDGLLVVSNAYPPSEVPDTVITRLSDAVPIHFVRWGGSADERTLAFGVQRLLHQIMEATGGSQEGT
jgi:hypothetical protein